jgi:hypothetical protein
MNDSKETEKALKALNVACVKMSAMYSEASMLIGEMFEEVQFAIFGKSINTEIIAGLNIETQKMLIERDHKVLREKTLTRRLQNVMDKMVDPESADSEPLPEYAPIFDAFFNILRKISELTGDRTEQFMKEAEQMIVDARTLVAQIREECKLDGKLSAEQAALFFEIDNGFLEIEALYVRTPPPLSDEAAETMSHVLDIPEELDQLIQESASLHDRFFNIKEELTVLTRTTKEYIEILANSSTDLILTSEELINFNAIVNKCNMKSQKMFIFNNDLTNLLTNIRKFREIRRMK